jgi:hypothetical protein
MDKLLTPEMLSRLPERLSVSTGAGTTSIGSASGGTTAGIGSVMGSTWAALIIKDAQPSRVLSKYFKEFTDLEGNNDVSLIIPKIGDINLMRGRTGDREGIKRSFYEFDSADNLVVTLTSTDVKLGGCLISYETAKATRVSILQMAHEQLVRQYSDTIELDANYCIENASSPAATVYGGAATSTGTITAEGVITCDKIVDMLSALMEANFAKQPGDAILFLHPKQYKRLLKSSQFVNAAEFGGSQVVSKGRIEEYLGVKLEISTLIGVKVTAQGDSYTTAAQAWGAASAIGGHYCYMIDPSAAAAIVWKERNTLKVESWDDERIHKVLMDSWYKMTRINEKSIVIGVFAD